MKQLRVGIIGCGRMGRERARASNSLGAQITLLCDENLSRAKELATLYPNSVVITDYSEIDRTSIDAIFICTPPFARGPVELFAIDSDLPFFVEKPIGLSTQHCFPILKALENKSLVHSVGYMNRYRKSVEYARDILSKCEPIGISCNWVGGMYKVPWWRNRSESGGPINEQCTHLIDLCRYLMGEIVEVYATAQKSSEGSTIEDTISVTLSFGSGALGTVFYSCMAEEKQICIQVFSPKQQVRLEGWNLNLWFDNKISKTDCLLDQQDNIFFNEVEVFFKAIETGDQTKIKSSFLDAMQTQFVIEAIQSSLIGRQPKGVTFTYL